MVYSSYRVKNREREGSDPLCPLQMSWNRPGGRSTRWTRSLPPCLSGGCGRWCRWPATNRPAACPSTTPRGKSRCWPARPSGSPTRPCGPITSTMSATGWPLPASMRRCCWGRTAWPTRGWRGPLPTSPCGSCSPTPRRSAAPPGTRCSPGCRRGTPPAGWSPLRTATPGTCRRCWTCATTTPSCGWCRSTTCRCSRTCWGCPAHPSPGCGRSTAISRPSPRARPS